MLGYESLYALQIIIIDTCNLIIQLSDRKG